MALALGRRYPRSRTALAAAGPTRERGQFVRRVAAGYLGGRTLLQPRSNPDLATASIDAVSAVQVRIFRESLQRASRRYERKRIESCSPAQSRCENAIGLTRLGRRSLPRMQVRICNQTLQPAPADCTCVRHRRGALRPRPASTVTREPASAEESSRKRQGPCSSVVTPPVPITCPPMKMRGVEAAAPCLMRLQSIGRQGYPCWDRAALGREPSRRLDTPY